jgi:hypothetical protein
VRGPTTYEGAPGVVPRREGRRTFRRRRSRLRGVLLLGVVLFGLVVAWRERLFGGPDGTVLSSRGITVVVPNDPSLPPLRQRIVATAESQLGYTSDPASTYCNKYSAYWQSGSSDCGNANLDEQWCADFAAWVWQRAGVPVTYAYESGDLNASSASFYEWGVAHGTWHPLGSGYVPQPGDVAVYGLDTATLYATHVAVVLGDVAGDRGPIAMNGDGDLTGFSVVEARADEFFADLHPNGAPLSGYVAPN